MLSGLLISNTNCAIPDCFHPFIVSSLTKQFPVAIGAGVSRDSLANVLFWPKHHMSCTYRLITIFHKYSIDFMGKTQHVDN